MPNKKTDNGPCAQCGFTGKSYWYAGPTCQKCFQRNWRENNPELYSASLERHKNQRKNNPEFRSAFLEKKRAWYAKDIEKSRLRSRMASFRRKVVDPDVAIAMLNEHDGTCTICGTTDPKTKQGWHLDHSHVTGKARGVLCLTCNHRLGHIEKTDPKILKRMFLYLALCGEPHGAYEEPEEPTEA